MAPRATLGTLDGIALLVGVVVGIGILRKPQVVAAQSASGAEFLLLWLAGGLLTLIGALCYAELGASRPHAGASITSSPAPMTQGSRRTSPESVRGSHLFGFAV